MLIHLHVKNLALIEEAEVDFSKGVNILTGETGAGKSILMGSVNLALGQKVSRDRIREGENSALVELVFQVNKNTEEKLKELDVYPEDGQVIITRKISETRSISKVNGETFTAAAVRKIASLLLDIHGQHEHQSLLYPDRQMEILDKFGGQEIQRQKEEVGKFYSAYRDMKKKLEAYEMDEEQRNRELRFLEYEIGEIQDARLREGEDEELEKLYRRLSNGRKITESLGQVKMLSGYEEGGAAQIGRALQHLSTISSLDEGIGQVYQALSDIDSLLNDFHRELSSYLSGFTYSEEEFLQTESRLDLINHLKSKYGKTIKEIFASEKEKEQELLRLQNFEEEKRALEKELHNQEECLKHACEILTQYRKKWAERLKEQVVQGLQDLNFLNVEFDISFQQREQYTAQGKDSIGFMISTNPGEPLRELAKVVSGGELSRIMLAIKALLADKDETETLIFDEIDTGISGRTAQKVAEKMRVIGENHQVICITHLPQIASQAEAHFLIEKNVEKEGTATRIRRLCYEESVEELARMLSGAQITEAVKKNAAEMKDLAQQQKNTRLK